jgi:hypothetical protein
MEDFLQKKNLFTISFSIITVLPIFDIQEKSRNEPVIGGLLNFVRVKSVFLIKAESNFFFKFKF